MSDNLLDLLKTLITVLVPIGVLWVKMYWSEKRRASDEKAREAVRIAALDKVASKAEEVADAVKEVAATTAETKTETTQKLDGIAEVVDKVHTLTNNNMQIQLELNKTVTRRLADTTGIQADVDAADLAEKKFKEHDDKQRKVDEKDAKEE